MLTKKEYLTHLSYGVNTCPAIYDAFEELIENYFKLLETYNKLEKSSYSLECQLHEIYYPNALKFEDLQIGMWVWDDKEKECIRCKLGNNRLGNECIVYDWDINPDGEFEEYYCEFKENRFYPVTKAMYRAENKQ